MAVLIRALAALALLSGCYSPELRDCTVSCSAPTDCSGGQVCGGDGYCAAEGAAGHCGVDASTRHDASPGHHDASTDDASMGPQVSLHVKVMGKGKVDVTGVGTCDTDGDQHGDCTWQVPFGAPLVLNAVVTNPSHEFMMWTPPGSCMGANPICTVTPLAPTSATAKFE